MSLMPEDSCERLLDGCELIGKAADGSAADMWEVFAVQSYGREVEIENGRINLVGGGGDGGFGLRVLVDSRMGFSYATGLEDIPSLVEDAMSAALLSPRINGMELPLEAKDTHVDGMWSSEVDGIQPEELMAKADELIEVVSELDDRAVITGGGVGIGCTAAAMATSQGILASGRTSSCGAGIQVSIDEDDLLTSGWSSMQSRMAIPDYSPVCEQAVEKAVSTRRIIKVEPLAREAPVLFTHSGISSLFSNIFCSALRGERLARGESVWSERMGTSVIESHLSIIDDGTIEGGSGSSRRDGEGSPTQRTTLIEDGILKSGIWSTRDACEQVLEGNVEAAGTTGNASRGGHAFPPNTGISNMLLHSSAVSGDRTSIIEEMDEGWVVQSVMGAHTANPSSGDFSVTSSSILKVDDGEIVGALKQAGISGNLPKAFQQDVQLARMSIPKEVWAGSSVLVPDILLRSGIRVNPS